MHRMHEERCSNASHGVRSEGVSIPEQAARPTRRCTGPLLNSLLADRVAGSTAGELVVRSMGVIGLCREWHSYNLHRSDTPPRFRGASFIALIPLSN